MQDLIARSLFDDEETTIFASAEGYVLLFRFFENYKNLVGCKLPTKRWSSFARSVKHIYSWYTLPCALFYIWAWLFYDLAVTAFSVVPAAILTITPPLISWGREKVKYKTHCPEALDTMYPVTPEIEKKAKIPPYHKVLPFIYLLELTLIIWFAYQFLYSFHAGVDATLPAVILIPYTILSFCNLTISHGRTASDIMKLEVILYSNRRFIFSFASHILTLFLAALGTYFLFMSVTYLCREALAPLSEVNFLECTKMYSGILFSALCFDFFESFQISFSALKYTSNWYGLLVFITKLLLISFFIEAIRNSYLDNIRRKNELIELHKNPARFVCRTVLKLNENRIKCVPATTFYYSVFLQEVKDIIKQITDQESAMVEYNSYIQRHMDQIIKK